MIFIQPFYFFSLIYYWANIGLNVCLWGRKYQQQQKIARRAKKKTREKKKRAFPQEKQVIHYPHPQTYTVCPGSSDPFYIVSWYIKWVTTAWTHSNTPLKIYTVCPRSSYPFYISIYYINWEILEHIVHRAIIRYYVMLYRKKVMLGLKAQRALVH